MPYLEDSTETQLNPQVINYLKLLGYEYVESGYRHSDPNRAPIFVDIIVFDNQHKPYIVVEAKTEIPKEITKFHPAVDQAYRNALQLNAPYFLVTDGKNASWYKIDKNQLSFEEISNPPRQNKSQQLQLQTLKPSEVADQLNDVIDLLRGSVKPTDRDVILSAFLLAKIYDENNFESKKTREFKVIENELASRTQSRISKLLQRSIKSHQLLVDENIINRLDASLVQNIVRKLEFIKINGTDLIGQYIYDIGSASKHNEGFFYTPAPIANLISQLFDFKTKKYILDPALGTGGLLAAVTKHVKETQGKAPQLIGVENNSTTATLASARLNALGALENGNILFSDFLFPGVQKKLLAATKNGFDIVVCDPPFGFNMGKSIEGEYIKAILNQLKPEGEASVILPDGILFSSKHREIREFLVTNASILTVISLPTNIYNPFSNIKTSIVVFRKKDTNTPNSPTLFLKIPDDIKQDNTSDIYLKVVETYKYFSKTKKLNKITSIQLAPSIEVIDPQNGFRMDYLAYAQEYIQTIVRLKRVDAEIVSLGDIASIRLGQFLNENAPTDVTIITVRDLREGWFVSTDSSNQNVAHDLFDFADIRLKPGDLLIPSILTTDIPIFLVPENINSTIASRSILVITPNREKIHPGYLFALFSNDVVKIQLKRISIGSTMRGTTPRLLREIQIPLLPMQEQKRIGEFIARYQELQHLAKMALQNADKSLDLFFGSNKAEENYENS